jgi:glycosyltransferase involved in cell wall biosynthesis
VALFPGFPKSIEIDRQALVELQRTAMALIHPCDPIAPSEFFCMSALECMAARTPVILSDADALPELWGDVCTILPRPIDYAAWSDALDNLLSPEAAYQKAKTYDWPLVAKKYLEVALDVPDLNNHTSRGSA